MRKLTLLLAFFTIIACEEKDLTSENPMPDEENLYLATSFLYDNMSINPDSALTNNKGQRFYITEVKVVLSDFYFYEQNDTIDSLTTPFIVTKMNPRVPLVQLQPRPGRGYSGKYGLRVGLDSLDAYNFSNPAPSDDNPVVQAGMLRPNNRGIDNVVIKGRAIDPEAENDTVGTIDLEYRLATHVTSKSATSAQKNFSLVNVSDVEFVIHVELEPIFNDFDVVERPTVTTDESNLIDYGIAQDMADSLRIRFF